MVSSTYNSQSGEPPVPYGWVRYIESRAHEWRSDVGSPPSKPLEGKKIGLLSLTGGDHVTIFLEAASQLEVQVTHISATDLVRTAAETARWCRLLELMFDAVACFKQPTSLTVTLRDTLSIPVFDDLDVPSHACQRLVDRLQPDAPEPWRRRVAIQAVLVDAMA